MLPARPIHPITITSPGSSAWRSLLDFTRYARNPGGVPLLDTVGMPRRPVHIPCVSPAAAWTLGKAPAVHDAYLHCRESAEYSESGVKGCALDSTIYQRRGEMVGLLKWSAVALATIGAACGPLLILSGLLYRPPGEANTILAIGGFSLWLAWTLRREARRAQRRAERDHDARA